MQDREYNELWEKSLRKPLTPGEQAQLDAWLAVRPDVRAEWEEEAALCAALRQLPNVPVSKRFTASLLQTIEHEEEEALSCVLKQLPDVPVSSNFTALVRQAVEREERQVERDRSEGFTAGWRLWVRRHVLQLATSAAVLMTACLLVVYQQQAAHRAAMANQVVELSKVPVPSVDTLKDYEVIRHLSQVSAEPDMELLAALQ